MAYSVARSSRARRLARQLACVASADGSTLARRLPDGLRDASADGLDRGGPGVLPDGSLAALRRMVRWDRRMPSGCPTACATDPSVRWRSTHAQRLPDGMCDGSFGSVDRGGPGGFPTARLDALLDNCITGKIREGIRSHTRPSWVRAGARSYSSWSGCR